MSAVTLTEIADELDAHGMTDYAESLRMWDKAMDAPRDITLTGDDLDALRSGRGSINRDGVAVYFD